MILAGPDLVVATEEVLGEMGLLVENGVEIPGFGEGPSPAIRHLARSRAGSSGHDVEKLARRPAFLDGAGEQLLPFAFVVHRGKGNNVAEGDGPATRQT